MQNRDVTKISSSSQAKTDEFVEKVSVEEEPPQRKQAPLTDDILGDNILRDTAGEDGPAGADNKLDLDNLRLGSDIPPVGVDDSIDVPDPAGLEVNGADCDREEEGASQAPTPPAPEASEQSPTLLVAELRRTFVVLERLAREARLLLKAAGPFLRELRKLLVLIGTAIAAWFLIAPPG